jgi:hypothetical protein
MTSTVVSGGGYPFSNTSTALLGTVIIVFGTSTVQPGSSGTLIDVIWRRVQVDVPIEFFGVQNRTAVLLDVYTRQYSSTIIIMNSISCALYFEFPNNSKYTFIQSYGTPCFFWCCFFCFVFLMLHAFFIYIFY